MGRKFTIFALFYFVFEGKFQVQAPPPGSYIQRDDLTEGFLSYDFGGLLFGGANFRNFTVLCKAMLGILCEHSSMYIVVQLFLFHNYNNFFALILTFLGFKILIMQTKN